MQRNKGVRLWLEQRTGRPAVYIIRDGARRTSTGCGAGDIAGANRALKTYLETAFRPNTSERDLARITCAEVLMLYGRDIAPGKPSAKTIGYHMKALLPFWGKKSLAVVRGSTCREYGKHRIGISGATVRRELKTFAAAINYWHKEHPLPAVPSVTLPPDNAPRERVLERREAARMLRAARRLKLPHVARFILIGLYTGTRHAAILALRWTESLVSGHPDLERGILYRRGRNERETSKRRPPCRIPRRLLAHMRRWSAMDDDGGHIIRHGGTGIAKMKRAWGSVVKEAGLGKDVTPHVLRHTCASWLLWTGATTWDVAGVIGADASTVQRVYGHHAIETEPERRKA